MSKPPFDPNKPFTSEKPAFDPSKPFDRSDGEQYNYTPLQKVSNALSSGMEFLNNPSGNNQFNEMAPQGDELFGRAGQAIAEGLGKRGYPALGAAIGTPVSLANPINWMTPEVGEIPKTNIYKPNIPAERAPIVAESEAMGLTPTLADKTGSRFAAGIENKLSRTPMGQGPISDVYAKNAKALEANKSKLASQYANELDPSVVGNNLADAIEANRKPVRSAKNEAFRNVYGDVNVPLTESESKALQFIQEQDKAPSGYGNPELRAKAEGILDIKNKVSGGQNIKTGDYYGAPDNKVGYKASPLEPTSSKANYEQIKIVREGLNGLIHKETSPSGEVSPTGQKYIDLKSALDRDISNFASQNTNNPLSDFKAQQFAETYNTANKASQSYAKEFKNKAVNDLMGLIRGGSPEKAIDFLFGPKNNVSVIRKVKAAAGEEAFNSAKQAWVKDLLEKKNIALELSKKEPEMLKEIFTPKELRDMKAHGDVANLNMTAERPGMGANKSESGTLNVRAAQYGGLFGGIGASLGTLNPLPAAVGITQFLAPRLASKLYLKAGEGISVGGARSGIARAGATAGMASDAAEREARLREFISRKFSSKGNESR